MVGKTMINTACYARVSTDRQEQEETIQSQLSELRVRAKGDGIPNFLEFTDEGYSRDTLARPGLDRLRDQVARGDLDRIYIQCPDRLGAGTALMLLYEEFIKHGVQVLFLNGDVQDTPEGKLLLHMQGAIAEYERAKIVERTRRGKLYWAKQGALVGGHAPYGYRWVRRTESHRARLEIDEYQAAVVKRMYRSLIEDKMTVRSIAKMLTEAAIPTRNGAAQWQPTSVFRILRNPAYKGCYKYQTTERSYAQGGHNQDPYRRGRKTARRPRSKEEWITIPVPAIVDETTWDRAQKQLYENSRLSHRNNKKHKYLLRGLIRCPRCRGAYSGAVQHGWRRYRCVNQDPSVSSTGKRCSPGSVSADVLEEIVWETVKDALQRPEVLVAEYKRRLKETGSTTGIDGERKQVHLALKRVKSQEDRVTDAYINEAMDLERYKLEMAGLGQRRTELERLSHELDGKAKQEIDSRKAVEQLERFCSQVAVGLNSMTFEEKQELLRLVVERITFEANQVTIETVIPTRQNNDELRCARPEPVEG